MDEATGHKRPPKSGRFRKGQSGNPRGRPRKAPSQSMPTSAFDVIVDRTLTITRNGVEREVSVEEALQHKTYQAALAGDRSARREVLRMIAKREAALAARRPVARPTIEFLDPEHDPRSADGAMLILGIACKDPRDHGPADRYSRLVLEPWAVQAALARRRGGAKLEAPEIDEIRRCTKDAASVRWPRGTTQ